MKKLLICFVISILAHVIISNTFSPKEALFKDYRQHLELEYKMVGVGFDF